MTKEEIEKYAKQEAILYSKFREDYKRIEGMNMQEEYRKAGGIFSWIGQSDEKIWEAYKKNEQLKRYFEVGEVK